LVPAWGETDVGCNRYHEHLSGDNLDWMRRDSGHRERDL
jgi:hypothetical protein